MKIYLESVADLAPQSQCLLSGRAETQRRPKALVISPSWELGWKRKKIQKRKQGMY